jgi:hypothetical protein
MGKGAMKEVADIGAATMRQRGRRGCVSHGGRRCSCRPLRPCCREDGGDGGREAWALSGRRHVTRGHVTRGHVTRRHVTRQDGYFYVLKVLNLHLQMHSRYGSFDCVCSVSCAYAALTNPAPPLTPSGVAGPGPCVAGARPDMECCGFGPGDTAGGYAGGRREGVLAAVEAAATGVYCGACSSWVTCRPTPA